MQHSPIILQDIEVVLPHKICFQNFSNKITYGSKIGIIGNNGSGKSTLLNMITAKTTSKNIIIPSDVQLAYVPQIINQFSNLSGGERVNKYLTQELQKEPNVIVLDEPTNHLDKHNRNGLIKMLNNYLGTLILVSHDQDLLSKCVDQVWYIDNEKINIFRGNYYDYINYIQQHRLSIAKKISKLNQSKQEIHEKLMLQQQKVAKRKQQGEKNINNKKWTKMAADLRISAAENKQGKAIKSVTNEKENLRSELESINIPLTIKPKFHITVPKNVTNQLIVQINNGKVSYADNSSFVLKDINFSLWGNSRVAIVGNNASGKSTLVKAILNDPSVQKEGYWFSPKINDIGYLDQHYNNLNLQISVFENIQSIVREWDYKQIRSHLNDFLFKKNEEVEKITYNLSAGEKARLSLAVIAAKTPKLLILDEITNNLDIQTVEHIIEILINFPLGIIVISHDQNFLDKIKIKDQYIL
ncbi:ATP-binding cassette domain-containing protein [Rickettsiales bacterium LUAb2]